MKKLSWRRQQIVVYLFFEYLDISKLKQCHSDYNNTNIQTQNAGQSLSVGETEEKKTSTQI